MPIANCTKFDFLLTTKKKSRSRFQFHRFSPLHKWTKRFDTTTCQFAYRTITKCELGGCLQSIINSASSISVWQWGKLRFETKTNTFSPSKCHKNWIAGTRKKYRFMHGTCIVQPFQFWLDFDDVTPSLRMQFMKILIDNSLLPISAIYAIFSIE